MKTPTFSIENWTTQRRVITGAAAAFALLSGVSVAAYVSRDHSKAPVIETSDGTVANGMALLGDAEKALAAWTKEAGATTPESPAAAHCFFVLDASGFVSKDLACGVAKTVGSNVGSYFDLPVTYAVDASTQEVTGALVEPAAFTLSTQTGDAAAGTLVRPDGLQPLPASVLNGVVPQSSDEMPVRLVGFGWAPAYDSVQIAETDILWNPEIDHNTITASGGVTTTVARAGQVLKVTDPTTGVVYEPADEATEWWIVETVDSTEGSWDGWTRVGSLAGVGSAKGFNQLAANGSAIFAVPVDQPLSVFAAGTGYEVVDATSRCLDLIVNDDDEARLIVTPSDRVLAPQDPNRWDS